MFPPGTTTPGVADRGRGGVLVAQLNNQLMTCAPTTRSCAGIPMTQVAIFGGAGQFSDNPTGGRQHLEDLDTQLCVTRSTTVDDVTAACQALFYPGAPEDDTKTPPVPAKPADARLAVCITANMATGVCTKYPDEQEGSFRTPSLINVAMTGPYFHTGLYNTLRDVVQHYNQGGAPAGTFAGTKSPRIRPLSLTDQEVDELVEFLKTLTGDPPDVDWSCDPSLPTLPAGQKSVSMGACASSADVAPSAEPPAGGSEPRPMIDARTRNGPGVLFLHAGLPERGFLADTGHRMPHSPRSPSRFLGAAPRCRWACCSRSAAI